MTTLDQSEASVCQSPPVSDVSESNYKSVTWLCHAANERRESSVLTNQRPTFCHVVGGGSLNISRQYLDPRLWLITQTSRASRPSENFGETTAFLLTFLHIFLHTQVPQSLLSRCLLQFRPKVALNERERAEEFCFAKIFLHQSCWVRWDGREIYPGPGPGRAVSLINGASRAGLSHRAARETWPDIYTENGELESGIIISY